MTCGMSVPNQHENLRISEMKCAGDIENGLPETSLAHFRPLFDCRQKWLIYTRVLLH